MRQTGTGHKVIAQTQHVLKDVYLPRVVGCLKTLSPDQIWWRPNEVSNSVGNLVLHLVGNVRQWIIAGLGGGTDKRQRDLEFSERGPLPRRVLIGCLREAVDEGCHILGNLAPEDLALVHRIQRYRVTGLEAAFHVAEHFAHHAGQIILLTKMMTGRDLKFTQLPGGRKRVQGKLPAW